MLTPKTLGYEKKGEVELAFYPPLLSPDWGFIFVNIGFDNWLFVSNLQDRISLAAEGTGDCSLLFYLQYISIAGKRVRGENCSRLVVKRGGRRALEWIDKEIPIKHHF